MSKISDSRLEFLTEAAHVIAEVAPEAAANLMSQRIAVAAENGGISDVDRQRVCTSCGYLTILGHNATLAFESRRPRSVKGSSNIYCKAKPKGIRQGVPMSKVITCHQCLQSTKITIPAPPSVARKPMKARPAQAVAQEDIPERKSSASASSRKRAKNRKAGLQALLQQKPGTSQAGGTGFGLSLADFTK